MFTSSTKNFMLNLDLQHSYSILTHFLYILATFLCFALFAGRGSLNFILWNVRVLRCPPRPCMLFALLFGALRRRLQSVAKRCQASVASVALSDPACECRSLTCVNQTSAKSSRIFGPNANQICFLCILLSRFAAPGLLAASAWFRWNAISKQFKTNWLSAPPDDSHIAKCISGQDWRYGDSKDASRL